MGTQLLPAGFRVWVAAATVSQIGDAVLYFALGWAATAYGGTAAGAVLAAVIVPRTVLMLLGGAIADRVGPRRVMITADALLLVGSVVAAVLAVAVGTPLWLLVAVAVVLGVTSSFYNPAAGSLPARLVEPDQLPRALALRNAGFQTASLAGGPLGGLLVAAGGMVAVLGVNAASFLVVLAALAVLRPRAAAPATGPRSLLGEMRDGLGVAIRQPALRLVLALYAVAGGFVIPLGSLVVPLLARERDWGAPGAGWVDGAIGAAALVGALVVSRTGVHPRTGLATALGLLGTAVGAVGLAVAPGVPLAVVAGLVIGAGLAAFIAHAGPQLVAHSPDTHLARVMALLGVVQSAAMIGTNLLLGELSRLAGAAPAAMVSAAFLLAAAVVAAISRALGGGGRESNPPDRDARPRRF